jgi:hypothetical protein
MPRDMTHAHFLRLNDFVQDWDSEGESLSSSITGFAI